MQIFKVCNFFIFFQAEKYNVKIRSEKVRLAQLLLQRGYDDDIVKAAELFQSASNSGDSKASAYLGKMYLEGLGVSANNDTAFKLFKKSGIDF